MFYTYKNTQSFRAKRHNAYEESSGEIGDTVTNITVVKAFAQEAREAKAFSSIWDAIKQFSVKEFKLHMINGFLRSLGLEWLWRLILKPKRWHRIYTAIIKFPLLVLKEKLFSLVPIKRYGIFFSLASRKKALVLRVPSTTDDPG